MKELKIDDPDKIIKKITNIPIMGYFSLIISIICFGLFIFGIIEMINNDRAAILFVIVGLSLFLLFFFIFYYHKTRIKKKIKNIDLEKVRKEIMEEVVGDPIHKTYFTKNYMLSNFFYGFIVDYKDILWVRERVLINPYSPAPQTDLVIHLKNGKKEFTEYIESYIDEIVKHNKNVLVGDTLENKNKYKEMLKK